MSSSASRIGLFSYTCVYSLALLLYPPTLMIFLDILCSPLTDATVLYLCLCLCLCDIIDHVPRRVARV